MISRRRFLVAALGAAFGTALAACQAAVSSLMPSRSPEPSRWWSASCVMAGSTRNGSTCPSSASIGSGGPRDGHSDAGTTFGRGVGASTERPGVRRKVSSGTNSAMITVEASAPARPSHSALAMAIENAW